MAKPHKLRITSQPRPSGNGEHFTWERIAGNGRVVDSAPWPYRFRKGAELNAIRSAEEAGVDYELVDG